MTCIETLFPLVFPMLGAFQGDMHRSAIPFGFPSLGAFPAFSCRSRWDFLGAPILLCVVLAPWSWVVLPGFSVVVGPVLGLLSSVFLGRDFGPLLGFFLLSPCAFFQAFIAFLARQAPQTLHWK